MSAVRWSGALMPARRVTINGRERIDPRHTRAWRKLRDQVVREEPVCRLQIANVCTGASTTAAHIKPVSTHPELALVRSNLEGACTECNEATGTLPRESIRLGTTTQPAALDIFD